MAEAVRIGVIGCGSVMSGPYMSLVERLNGRGAAEVVGACDALESKREYVRDRFGITNFTTDFEELISQENVDLVLITTSMNEHGMIARAALEAGKHVLVEKPMSTSLEEAAQLLELSKRSKGYLLRAPH